MMWRCFKAGTERFVVLMFCFMPIRVLITHALLIEGREFVQRPSDREEIIYQAAVVRAQLDV